MVERIDLITLTDDLLEIRCVVSGLPYPTVTWSRDDDLLVNDDRTQISLESDTSTLTITGVTFGDGGLYSCVGTSKSGSSTQELQINLGKEMMHENGRARYTCNLSPLPKMMIMCGDPCLIILPNTSFLWRV